MDNVRIATADFHPAQKLVSLAEPFLAAETVEERGIGEGIRDEALVEHIFKKIGGGGDLALAAEGLHERTVGLEIGGKTKGEDTVEEGVSEGDAATTGEGVDKDGVGMGVGRGGAEEGEGGREGRGVGRERSEEAVEVLGRERRAENGEEKEEEIGAG